MYKYNVPATALVGVVRSKLVWVRFRLVSVIFCPFGWANESLADRDPKAWLQVSVEPNDMARLNSLHPTNRLGTVPDPASATAAPTQATTAQLGYRSQQHVQSQAVAASSDSKRLYTGMSPAVFVRTLLVQDTKVRKLEGALRKKSKQCNTEYRKQLRLETRLAAIQEHQHAGSDVNLNINFVRIAAAGPQRTAL